MKARSVPVVYIHHAMESFRSIQSSGILRVQPWSTAEYVSHCSRAQARGGLRSRKEVCYNHASPPLCLLTCTLLNLYSSQVAHPDGVYPCFHCMKWLGVFIFPVGWNACPSIFPDLPPVSSLGWRETLWQKRICLRTQHNDPCRSRTQTSRPEYSTLTIRPPRPPPCAQLFSICLFVCFFFFFPSIYLLILLNGTSLSHWAPSPFSMDSKYPSQMETFTDR